LAETPFSGFWYDDAEEAGWFSKGGIYNFIYLHIGHLSTHFSFLLSMIRGITVGTWAILYYVKMYQKVDFAGETAPFPYPDLALRQHRNLRLTVGFATRAIQD
jgi:hypothetical protein